MFLGRSLGLRPVGVYERNEIDDENLVLSYLTLSNTENGDRGDRCAPNYRQRHDPLWALSRPRREATLSRSGA